MNKYTVANGVLRFHSDVNIDDVVFPVNHDVNHVGMITDYLYILFIYRKK